MQPGRQYRDLHHVLMNREPFFGQNAKAWAIQFAFLIFCIIFVLPWLNRFFDPYARYIVDNALCRPTGWCTPGDAETNRVSMPR